MNQGCWTLFIKAKFYFTDLCSLNMCLFHKDNSLRRGLVQVLRNTEGHNLNVNCVGR